MAAVAVGALAWAWPETPGVMLGSAERWAVVMRLAGLAGLVGGVAGLLAGRRGAWLGAVLPAGVVLCVAWLPREGRLHLHVPLGWWLVPVGLVGLAVGLHRWRPWLTLGLAVACAVAALPRLVGARPTPAVGPDVLLLTLDTTRADLFDFCGGDQPTAHTPVLSALAARAVVYTAAFAPVPLTGPSHATILSGVEPEAHGVLVNGASVPLSLPWLPAILREAGWATTGLVSAAVLDASLGFDRGFDRFDSTFSDRLARGHGLWSFVGWRLRAGSAHSRPGAQTVALLPARDRPRFVWVHLYDAHWPYTPSERAARAHGLAAPTPLRDSGLLASLLGRAGYAAEEVARGAVLYRAQVDDLDRQVGRLLEPFGDDAIIVVTGDHGESLGEHDYAFAHGRLPYAPDTRVPLLVTAPGLAHRVVDLPVGLDQVAPSILGLLGLPVPAPIQGRSLLDLDPDAVVVSIVPGVALSSTEPAVDSHGLAGVALRQGSRSVVRTAWSPAAAFDRVADPRELEPLPIGDSDLAPLLDAAWRTRPAGAAVEEDLGPALEALGYQ